MGREERGGVGRREEEEERKVEEESGARDTERERGKGRKGERVVRLPSESCFFTHRAISLEDEARLTSR